jgi:hypothetical protein
MSIRLDPRRLSALKQLAGDAGLRPGELVTRWVEERVDAERGGAGGTPPLQAPRTAGPDLGSVLGRLEELSARVAALEAGSTGGPEVQTPVEEAAPVAEVEAPAVAEPRRRGRPRQQPEESPAPKRVPLHEEIAAVIEERGPSTAAEIADAIAARGRYAPPRSGKPLDSATVNSRVSNPVYRSRFVRREGRIGLAEPAA